MAKSKKEARQDKRAEKKQKRQTKKKDVKVSLDTKNVDIEFERKDGVVTGELDTKNFDVKFEKRPDGTEIEIIADKPFGKFVGRIIRKAISKRGK